MSECHRQVVLYIAHLVTSSIETGSRALNPVKIGSQREA